MAGAAETYMFADSPYRFVDDLPEVAQERQERRDRAEALLERRRAASPGRGGEFDLPLQIDTLSTADKVLDAARRYGEGSAQHVELHEGLVLDCRRLLAEWHRKNRPEYFPRVRHAYDAELEDFVSHGLGLSQMTENGIVPMPDDPEDEARRVNEHVEDATPRILRRCLGRTALAGVAVRTISGCTDKAESDYATDMRLGRKQRSYKGYVPQIKKLMVRDIVLDADSDDRFEEQIGLPGIYIDKEVIAESLGRRGLQADDMDKTRIHGTQILARDGLMEFAELLDSVASEKHGIPVFMGEKVEADHPRDYAHFRQEAIARQEAMDDQARTVALYVLDLAAEGFDRRKAPAKVEQFVKILLLDQAKQDVKRQMTTAQQGEVDTAIAEQMFDKATAFSLKNIVRLELAGLTGRAFEQLKALEVQAPGGGFCGAGGGCGLESVDISSEAGQEIIKKLGAKPGETITRDTERTCKCGSKQIYYAHSSTVVRKYCDACGASESKITSPKK